MPTDAVELLYIHHLAASPIFHRRQVALRAQLKLLTPEVRFVCIVACFDASAPKPQRWKNSKGSVFSVFLILEGHFASFFWFYPHVQARWHHGFLQEREALIDDSSDSSWVNIRRDAGCAVGFMGNQKDIWKRNMNLRNISELDSKSLESTVQLAGTARKISNYCRALT